MTDSEAVLRIGIAGLGQAGSALVAAVGRNPRTVVAAVADPRAEVVAAFTRDFAARGYDDIDGLCLAVDVDVVYIATPTHLHARHSLLALAAGKHVIVEKPMAVTLDDATAMIDAAATSGRQLIVGHSQSFEPSIRAMRALIRGGELGELRMLHTWSYTDWLYRPRLPAELDGAQGGGALFRQGAHQVDILRWIGGGLVRSVRAALGSEDRARPGQGSHTLFLNFEGGVAATAVYSGHDHFQTGELVGLREDGRAWDRAVSYASARAGLRAADAGGETALKDGLAYGRPAAPGPAASASAFGLTVVSCERGDIRQVPRGLAVYGEDRRWEIDVSPIPDGRDVLLFEAYDAVVHGAPPAHDGRWGRANLEVCVAAAESSRTDREVELRFQVPTPD